MEFSLFEVSEELNKNFKPLKRRLTCFEAWAMVKAYCQLYRSNVKCQPEEKIADSCVWNGSECYNADYQITKDDGSTRLWLNEVGSLMLEIYYDDERPSRLFVCQ